MSKRRFASYFQGLDFLYRRNQFAMKLGLENMLALVSHVGHPERAWPCVHVAGTNGKGSVCRALAASLPLLGYRKVGLYTSPHLVSFRERMMVGEELISKEYVLKWLNENVAFLEDRKATYFECVTCLAFCWFRDCGCDMVVLETGLGGRLDATNVCKPEVCVLTSMSLDHESVLGNTLEEIFSEKLGILKPKVPVVTVEKRASLVALLEAKSRELEVAVHRPAMSRRLEVEMYRREVLGAHHRFLLPEGIYPSDFLWENASLALGALDLISGPARSVDMAMLSQTLSHWRMPGRLQLLQSPGMPDVLLDAAHNPEGCRALASHLARYYPGRPMQLVFASMADKDWLQGLRHLLPLFGELAFLELPFPRALKWQTLQSKLDSGVPRMRLIENWPGEVARWTGPEESASRQGPLKVICGSIYLLGQVIPELAAHYSGLNFFRGFDAEEVSLSS